MWWHDRAGRFSPLKAVCLAMCVAPAIWLGIEWATGATGPRTMDFLNHATGNWALRFILAALAVTPFRTIFRYPKLFQIRRILGVTGFCYLVAHFGFYIGLQNGRLGFVASEILKHSYLTIGFGAWLVLGALTLTSTDAMIARLGQWWRRLHWLIYPATAAGVLHFMMQGKSLKPDATTQMGILVWLIGWRYCPQTWRSRGWFLTIYALIAAAITAGLEVSWFALATHVDVLRVWDANFRWGYRPRPAIWVLMLGIGVMLAVVLRTAQKDKKFSF